MIGIVQVHSFNSITVLLFHLDFYVCIAIHVLKGGTPEGHDNFSFDLPPVRSQEDWENLLDKFREDAETFAS